MLCPFVVPCTVLSTRSTLGSASAQGSVDWVSTCSNLGRVKPKTLKLVPVRNARGLARQSQDNVSGGLVVVK